MNDDQETADKNKTEHNDIRNTLTNVGTAPHKNDINVSLIRSFSKGGFGATNGNGGVGFGPAANGTGGKGFGATTNGTGGKGFGVTTKGGFGATTNGTHKGGKSFGGGNNFGK